MSNAAKALDEAAAVLSAGGVVVYPTETLYGLGVRADSQAALEGLYSLKGREAGSGVSVLVAGLSAARSFVEGRIPGGGVSLAAEFWPVPLTMVMPAAAGLDPGLKGPTGGVALRCSSDPNAAGLLSVFGAPVTATSANLAGQRPARNIAEARDYFGSSVGAYVDGGNRDQDNPSTVVEFLDGRAYLRRSGRITLEDLARVVEIDGLQQ